MCPPSFPADYPFSFSTFPPSHTFAEEPFKKPQQGKIPIIYPRETMVEFQETGQTIAPTEARLSRPTKA